MKTGTIFWGSLLVSLGVTLLALQQHWIMLPWNLFRDYWAVLLILWGVALLIRKTNLRWIIVTLAAVTAGVAIASTTTEVFTSECRAGGWNIRFHDRHYAWDDDDDDNDKDCDDDDDCDSTQNGGVNKQNNGNTKDSLQQKQNDSTKTTTPLY